MSHTRITQPDRIDRLLLILVLAYFPLVGLGLWAKRNLPHAVGPPTTAATSAPPSPSADA